MRQKITIYTLAEELNVSVSSISRAFNPAARLKPEKRERILAAAAKYNFTPNRAAARLSSREIRIGAIVVNRIPDFYRSMHAGLEDAAKSLEAQKVSADIRALTPDADITRRVLDVLNEFSAAGYDGIILHGIYDQGIISRIDSLTEAGIAVATLHNDLPNSRRLFTSTCNTQMTGDIAAELLHTFIRSERRNVVMFTGSMFSPIHQQLVASFSASCPRYGLNLLQSYDTMDVPSFVESLVESAFSTCPDIDGIYVSSANSIPICQYLEQHGLAGKVALITSDTFPALNDYLRRGIVSATIHQDPYGQGKNAFTHLYAAIAENTAPPSILMTRPQIVLRSNVSLFENRILP